jgi:manganese/iron transport system permease protein
MFHWLVEPLTLPFMLRGLAAAVLVGIVCAVVGTYVVLRGMAFFGDAVAHAILPGVAVGYILSGGAQGPIFTGGLLAAVAASLGINAISKSGRLKEDTAIGIIFAGMFALGIALISTVRSYAVDLTHFLFGDVLGVSQADLILTFVLGAIVLITIGLLYKEFMVMAFDPILAVTLRLPVNLLDNLLLILVAIAIVAALQTVGVALTVAMLVTPAATASLLTRRLWQVMVLAAALAVAASVLGLYASYYFSVASGAAIVMASTLLFALVWAGSAAHGRFLARREAAGGLRANP